MDLVQLKKAISNLITQDQADLKEFRKGSLSLIRINSNIKNRNEKIRKILSGQIFPGKSLGETTYKSFIALVLHSDDDEIMEGYLLKSRKMEPKEVDKSLEGYLIDKLLIKQGKPQEYGTQYKDVSPNGTINFFPIEKVEEVDKRRNEIGLPSLDEYRRTILENRGT